MNKIFLIILFAIISNIALGKIPIVPNKGANDPQIRSIDGKAYLSLSHDSKKFIMEDWWLWSSDDLVNWKLEYTLKPEETYIGKLVEGCWETTIVKRNGNPLLLEEMIPTDEYDMGIIQDKAGEYYIVFTGEGEQLLALNSCEFK